jgi:hypothetical protein
MTPPVTAAMATKAPMALPREAGKNLRQEAPAWVAPPASAGDDRSGRSAFCDVAGRAAAKPP